MTRLRFIAGIVFILSQIDWGHTKLLFLQTISRHGDRAPILRYPWDLTTPDFWPEGYEMLSKLGKKQNYALGKYLRLLYKDFVTSNPNEVLVNSTDIDRCIVSGLSLMASFYAPVPKWAFEENFDWQPIPIHYKPYNKDKYLTLNSDCPRLYKEIESMYKSPEYIVLTTKYKHMLAELSPYFGSDIWPMEFLVLQDTLLVKKKYNLSLPIWAELFYNQITEFADRTVFHAWTSPGVIRLQAGPILGKIVDDMKKKVAGEIPNLKVQAYLLQSNLLISVMSGLGVFNDKMTPYCATVILELHETTSGGNAVRLLYLNSTEPENGYQVPNVLQVEGCLEYCPLEYFVSYVKKSVPQDWERECGLT